MQVGWDLSRQPECEWRDPLRALMVAACSEEDLPCLPPKCASMPTGGMCQNIRIRPTGEEWTNCDVYKVELDRIQQLILKSVIKKRETHHA